MHSGDHRVFEHFKSLGLLKQAFVAMVTVFRPGNLDAAPEALFDCSVLT